MKSPRIGLALAGGGFLGAAYELGALAALAESIDGLELNRLDAYVGVSAGSFVAAGLANGLSPYEMVRMFIDSKDKATSFDPTGLVQPAYRELADAIRALPGVSRAALAASLENLPLGLKAMLWRALERVGPALPTGLLSSEPAQKKLAELLNRAGRSNDFRQLAPTLRVVATDIDSGKSISFGEPGFDHIPISQAVAASSAIPGLFAPVVIDGRYYVDGALNKTLHASVALDAGAELVFCINPLVPYAARHSASERLAARLSPHNNLTSLLSQSVRTAIRSRMSVGLEKYRITHPHASVLLFEPNADDARTFHASMFSVTRRRELCEHAYQQTRADLRLRAQSLSKTLARHNLQLNHAVLAERSLTLFSDGARTEPALPQSLDATATRLRYVLDDLDRTMFLSQLGALNRG